MITHVNTQPQPPRRRLTAGLCHPGEQKLNPCPEEMDKDIVLRPDFCRRGPRPAQCHPASPPSPCSQVPSSGCSFPRCTTASENPCAFSHPGEASHFFIKRWGTTSSCGWKREPWGETPPSAGWGAGAAGRLLGQSPPLRSVSANVVYLRFAQVLFLESPLICKQ